MSNLERARKTYEAMNYEIIEQLPVLTKHSVKIFFLAVRNFITITSRFVHSTNSSIQKIIDVRKFHICVDL